MQYYCEKKKKHIPNKRAKRKCVKVNLNKRGRICSSLRITMNSWEFQQLGGRHE